MSDIFEADLELNDDVYLVAPGEQGAQAFDKIPAGADVFAVNYGVAAPFTEQAGRVFWVVADAMAHMAPWWTRATAAYWKYHPEPLADGRCEGRIFSKTTERFGGSCAFSIRRPEFQFSQGSALDYRDAFPQYGVIRTNATVVGDALQLTYWIWHNSGKRRQGRPVPPPRVWLVGCDMAGGKYFDGMGVYPERAGVEWPHMAALQRLVDVLQAAGMVIDSLSPTVLKFDGGNE